MVSRVTEGWQECARTAWKGAEEVCLPRSNSDDEPLFLRKITPLGVKFSREFGAKCQAKQYFGQGKPSNSLENLIVFRFQLSSKWLIWEEFTLPKHYNLIKVCKWKDNLSPSCHPWHPLKRVQMPCISAFCHPDTLFSKNFCVNNQKGSVSPKVRITDGWFSCEPSTRSEDDSERLLRRCTLSFHLCRAVSRRCCG